MIAALERQQLEVVNAGKNAEATVKQQYKDHLLSTRDYYGELKAYALDANTTNATVVQAEIDAVKKSGLSADEKASRYAKLNQELAKLGQDRIAITRDTDAAIAEIGVKETLAANEAHGKYLQTMIGETAKIREQVKAIVEQTAEYGMSKEAIQNLRAAELELQATKMEGIAIRALEKAEIKDGIVTGQAEYNLIMDKAAALRDKAAADRGLGTKQKQVDENKEVVKKTSE
jgi:lipase chaperone LimK